MSRLGLYLEAIRFARFQGTILLFLPCAIALGFLARKYTIDYSLYMIFFAGAFLVRSGACVINDIWDVQFDSKVTRTQNRPLASGKITRLEALLLSVGLLLLALYVLSLLSYKAIIAGIFAPVLFGTYPLFKRFTHMPQIYLGICMSYGVLMVGLEVEQKISYEMLLLFIAMVFWTFAYDTIYAYQDIADDRRAGVKSSALYFGSKGKKYIIASYIICVSLLLIVSTRFDMGFIFFLLLNILAIYILARVQYIRLDNVEDCKVEFEQNIYYGIFIYLIIILLNLTV